MSKSIFDQTKEKLLNFINNQKLPGNKLPSEEELAELLHVSRGTVREVLRTLNREGIISKKHGFGNFVQNSALNARMRIDQLEEFYALIEDGGYIPSIHIEQEANNLVTPGEKIRVQLGLNQNEQAYYFSCLYKGDQIPAIYCKMFFPTRIFFDHPNSEVRVKSIFEFLKTYCKQEVDHTLVWFRAENCNEEVARKLQIPVESPIMVWEELLYNFFDEIICSSVNYFNPQIMRVCMLRKQSTSI